MTETRRADVLLVERGLFESRAKARAAIEAGGVRADGAPVTRAAQMIALGADIQAELRAFVAERLAAFKVPVRILFWHETLPRNANGKIMKNELKKVFVEG